MAFFCLEYSLNISSFQAMNSASLPLLWYGLPAFSLPLSHRKAQADTPVPLSVAPSFSLPPPEPCSQPRHVPTLPPRSPGESPMPTVVLPGTLPRARQDAGQPSSAFTTVPGHEKAACWEILGCTGCFGDRWSFEQLCLCTSALGNSDFSIAVV